jgi:hypothetical protein
MYMGGLGVSIFLFAVGAILAFAVNVNTRGVDLNAVGVILMIVGGIGMLLSLLFWSNWSPYRRDENIVVDEPHLHRHDHVA